jgi:hypothetical protein
MTKLYYNVLYCRLDAMRQTFQISCNLPITGVSSTCIRSVR